MFRILVLTGALVTLVTASLVSAREDEPQVQLRDWLRRSIANRDFDGVRDAVTGLVQVNTPAAMDVLIEFGLLSGSPKVEEICDHLMKQGPKGPAMEYLCQQATASDDYRVRDRLTLIIARRPEMSAYRAVLTNLYDRRESVMLAALEAVELRNHLGSVSHLIRALKYQEDNDRHLSDVAHHIRKTLTHMTGYEYHHSDDWQAFWDENEKGFRKPTRKQLEKTGTRPKVTRKSGNTAVVEELDLPDFFGEEILADRIVFVIDVSISMAEKDPVGAHELGGRGGRGGAGGSGRTGRTGVGGREKGGGAGGTGGAGGGGEDGLPQERMRVRRVQAELVRMIRSLPRSTRFSVVSFSDEVRRFSGTLVDATSGNKERACKWVQKFNPSGETYTDRALETAFAVPGTRSIFLLSDGGPFRDGKPINALDILDWVQKNNRYQRITVNTIGFRAARDECGNFLEILAVQNSGRFREI